MVHVIEGEVHPGHINNKDEKGGFKRIPVAFRNWISASPDAEFPAEKGRYHIFASYLCPWASRVALVRGVKKLEDVISMSVLHPERKDDVGWHFAKDPEYPECDEDTILGKKYMYEYYLTSNPKYTGGITVPVLWDLKKNVIVNNESADIIRMLSSEFNAFTDVKTEYYPAELRKEIDEVNELVYGNVNNGVYKCGFTNSQEVYDVEVRKLFSALDQLDARLSNQRYLCGDTITEADWRLFVTLVRFDCAYYEHFKCNIRRIEEYEHLSHYLRELYQHPGVADSVKFQHICNGYQRSHESVNPKLTVPKGGLPDLTKPHNRGRFEMADIVKGQSDQGDKSKGAFVRPDSGHRNWVTADGSSGFKAEAGRYHLYIANNCPWCHRVTLARSVLGLTDVISMDVLFYRRDQEKGWQFKPDEPGCTNDTVNGFQYIRQVYDLESSTEKSVPILFDKQTKKIVSNESSEILRMMNSAFREFMPKDAPDLYPEGKRQFIDFLNAWIYQDINNGAYKAGFTSSQESYEAAYDAYFAGIDRLEDQLRRTRFLTGDTITEADIRLFPTIFRQDHVYHIRMKLNKFMIRDERPALHRWLLDMWHNVPGVEQASNMDHCKKGYFGRTGNTIVPAGPTFGFDSPYALSQSSKKQKL